MTVEIQVAISFLISFMYNKLPRRRVNNFGEELESALRHKFEGHWYPDKPFKGSAYRCLKTTQPLDPVFLIAARESGMDLDDIQENLPHELSIWIDPGEVSYRMSEKGPVKILYSDGERRNDSAEEHPEPQREVIKSFNPEAQVFQPGPVDMVQNQFGGMSIGNNCGSNTTPVGYKMPLPTTPCASSPYGGGIPQIGSGAGLIQAPFKTPTSLPLSGFGPKPSSSSNIMSAGQFAQTKFGSTKLKTSGKRNNQQRLSPTECGNLIKQKSLLQQQQQQFPHSMSTQQYFGGGNMSPGNSRSISPESLLDSMNFPYMQTKAPQIPSPPSLVGSQSLMGSNTFGGSVLGSGGHNTSSFMGGSILDSSLDELFGYSTMTPFKQSSFLPQDETSPSNHFSSFLDSHAFTGTASSSSSASIMGSSPDSTGSNSSGSSPPITGADGTSHPLGMTSPTSNNSKNVNSNATSNGSGNNNSAASTSHENLNVNGVSSYTTNQYQHLLVANWHRHCCPTFSSIALNGEIHLKA